MTKRQPKTETMNATAVRQQWSQILKRVFQGESRIIVEKSSIPVAAIISAEDLERFKLLEAQRAEQFRVLNEAQAAFKDVSEEELDREIEKAIREVREERRKQQVVLTQP